MIARRCLPDPAWGRLLRGIAIGLVIACAATGVRRGDLFPRGASRRVASPRSVGRSPGHQVPAWCLSDRTATGRDSGGGLR